MNDGDRNELLREIFRQGAESVPGGNKSTAGNTRHPIDDDELLIRWSLDELDPAEHEQIITHLAECPPCRRELAAMVRAGALVLPEAEQPQEDPRVQDRSSPAVAISPHSEKVWYGRKVTWVVAALAASLVFVLFWGLSDIGGETPLAVARRDLDRGDNTAAFDRVASYLDEKKGLTSTQQSEARSILEESGYRLARKGLVEGDFSKVLDIEQETTRRTDSTGRLLNLRIQAERGETEEATLGSKASLIDYDIELDGRKQIKGFPTFDATITRIKRELVEAAENHPDSVPLRLNLGQLLLEQNEHDRAVEQFAAAVRLDPQNPLAETGLGLALFQQDTDDYIRQSLPHFRKAVELSPDDFFTNLNMAICLTRLEKQHEARPYFDTALSLCPTSPLKQGIEKALSGT